MRRRWIAAGLVLVALVATLAVLVLGRAEAPLPDPCWCCATTGDVRTTPHGETLSDVRFMELPGSGSNDMEHRPGSLFRVPTLVDRVVAFINGRGLGMSLVPVRRTGTVETADGRSWEKFELDATSATPR